MLPGEGEYQDARDTREEKAVESDQILAGKKNNPGWKQPGFGVLLALMPPLTEALREPILRLMRVSGGAAQPML